MVFERSAAQQDLFLAFTLACFRAFTSVFSEQYLP
jgi:hypothetical protein